MQLTVDSGQLPKGWEVKTIGEVCKTGAGGTPLKSKKEYYEGGKIPWLLSGEVAQGEIFKSENFITQTGLENSSAKIFPINTVLVAMYGATAGQVGILRFEAATNQAVCGILPNEKFIPEFIYYVLLLKKAELISQATGNAQPNISQIKIKNTEIPIPPLPEQKRIVAILDEAFEGIDRAISNTEKNLSNARELFESYLNSIFSQKGEGWEEKKLGDIATFRNGLNFTKSSKGESIKIVGVKYFQNHFWIQEDQLESVTIDAELKEIDILRKGDILTVRSNGNKELIGRCVLAGDIYEKTSHSGFTIRIRIEREDIYPQFIVHYLKSKQLRKQLTESGGGISISSLNQQGLSLIKLSFPTFAKQKAIVANIDELATETQQLENIYRQKIAALKELKQSILQKAFTGELTTDKGVTVMEETAA